MKICKIEKVYILALLITNLFFISAKAQPLIIQGAWRIAWEDKAEFSKPGYNDSAWQNIKELKWSDDQKKTANRTLWVRKKIIIPSSLKTEFERTGIVTLSMGKISQSDDTYLNGKKIGSTGSGDTYRNYLVFNEDILWDKENTIAIRVNHWGTFKVSIIPTLITASPANFIKYNSTVKDISEQESIQNKDVAYQLNIINKSPKNIDGFVTADFYNFNGVKVYNIKKSMALSAGNNPIVFRYKSLSPFIKIVYTVNVPVYDYSGQWNAEFGYENVKYKRVIPLIAYRAPQKYFPADLEKISIEGWLGDRLKANTQQRLNKVDEEALLAGFINRPGNHSWIGEHIGKFLDAACNAYANNADPVLKIKIDRSAQQLIAAQLPDGYLGTYDGDSHWTSWDVWSHRYDIIGLLKYYELSGFKPALTASRKIGDLIMQTFGTEKGQRDIVKAGGHKGMAATCILESMAELYRFSGEKKYIDYCYYVVKSFDNPGGPGILTMIDSVGRLDKVANAKAYEMMSNFLGIIKLYRLTNDEQFLKPLQVAWKDVVNNRLYITGTSSSFEHFQDNDVLPATDKDNMGEGCVTTTWVQFNYQLFCITGEMKYLDELERSVYNHLTGAENPQTGGVSYYTPLMGKKPFRTVITCCMSSVPRGIAMFPLFASGKFNKNPVFLFYQPGYYATVVGNSNISFTTTGDFLKGENIIITVNSSSTMSFPLLFRKPYWANDFTIKVNGQNQLLASSEIAEVKRPWRKGDKIEINFTLPTIVLDGGKSYPNYIALQRGPQVLSFDSEINSIDPNDVTIDEKNVLLQPANISLPANWVGDIKFQVNASVNHNDRKIVLVPYADASQSGAVMSTWLKTKAK